VKFCKITRIKIETRKSKGPKIEEEF